MGEESYTLFRSRNDDGRWAACVRGVPGLRPEGDIAPCDHEQSQPSTRSPLVYSWHHWHTFNQVKAASLIPVHVPTGSDLYLTVILWIATLVSFTASQRLYQHAARTPS